jgi:hypothetical protein
MGPMDIDFILFLGLLIICDFCKLPTANCNCQNNWREPSRPVSPQAKRQLKRQKVDSDDEFIPKTKRQRITPAAQRKAVSRTKRNLEQIELDKERNLLQKQKARQNLCVCYFHDFY